MPRSASARPRASSRRRSGAWLLVISLMLHGYVGLRLIPDLPSAAGICLAFYLTIAAVLTPYGLLSGSRRESPAIDPLAWAGYLAMGALSTLWVLTFLRDLALVAEAIFELAGGNSWPAFASTSAAAVPLIALAITLVGFYNARRLARIVHVRVPVMGLAPALEGFTLAQISDIHIGRTIGRGYVQAIVRAVNALSADVIVITGDLIDGDVPRLAAQAAPLANLKARHGVFGVTGNHEYYSGVEAWLPEFSRLGIDMLMNAHRVLLHGGARLLLAGVTDFSAGQFDPATASDPAAAMAGAPTDISLKVLLAHQPRSAPEAERAGFDLQLSGHTHGGQFAPWMFFVRLQQPFVAGLRRLGRLWIYTSRGTGYWGPPLRFGAPSEITLLRLTAA